MAQQPLRLHPDQSPQHLFGAHLRALRENLGLSQASLGRLVFCSSHLIGKIEKGERRPQPDLIGRCDAILEAEGTLVALGRALENDVSAPQNADTDPVFQGVPQLRRCLDAHDLPEDGPSRSIPELRRDVHELVGWRLNSDYNKLALRLPALLPELQRAYLATRDPAAAALLTQAYRAADAIADKFGLHDLSARIIGLMREVAAQSADPLTVATAEYVRAELFFASGDWSTGRRMVLRSASEIKIGVSPAANAAYGALHMRAAVLAARDGVFGAAAEHIREARAVAETVPEGIYRGTAFGPESVRIHRLSLALDSGDIDEALAAAADWRPSAVVPAERRSHFYVDLARAQVLAGRAEAAIDTLCIARATAPQHVRHHPEVKGAVSTLLATAARPTRVLLDMSRWVGVLPKISMRDEADPAAPPASR